MKILLKSIIHHVLYYPLFSIIFFTISCAQDKGVIITQDGTEKKGYIRFDECADRSPVNSEEKFIDFKESVLSGWKKISSINVSEVNMSGKTFVYIDSKKIKDDFGPPVKIPANLIITGDISVYSYCSVKYMSTMLSSKRLDMIVYLLSKKGDDNFYIIPHDVEQFKIFSAEHFSSCTELIKDINNSKFKKRIENPVPGNITEYELVDEKDITGFVVRYNECSKSK